MTYHSRSMDIYMIFYYYTTNTRNMSINTIPIANFIIMPYNSIGLNHIEIAYLSIITNNCIRTDKITFSQFCISIETSCLMNQINKFTTPTLNFLNALFTLFISY